MRLSSPGKLASTLRYDDIDKIHSCEGRNVSRSRKYLVGCKIRRLLQTVTDSISITKRQFLEHRPSLFFNYLGIGRQRLSADQSDVMSAPSLIFKAGGELFRSGEIWNDLYVSGIEFIWGFALSVVIGIPLGIATGGTRGSPTSLIRLSMP